MIKSVYLINNYLGRVNNIFFIIIQEIDSINSQKIKMNF